MCVSASVYAFVSLLCWSVNSTHTLFSHLCRSRKIQIRNIPPHLQWEVGFMCVLCVCVCVCVQASSLGVCISEVEVFTRGIKTHLGPLIQSQQDA